MKQHTLWIEAYRPKNLDHYIGNDDLKERVAGFIAKNDIPHLLLHGSAGGGKTTLAKLIVGNIECDKLYMNASDENGIDVIRDKVKQFTSAASFSPIKVVILDEADFLTQAAQAALRNVIEEYSLTTRFILTCNYIERIIDPLQSRCEIHKLVPPSKGAIAKHLCKNILDKESITYDIKEIASLVNEYYPDVRSMIKNLQAGIKDNAFVVVKKNINWCSELVKQLKSRDNKAWYNIRQIIADEQVTDFQTAYRYMFDNLSEFSYGNDAELSIILDDFIWRASVVPDKEINFSACIARILDTNKKKVI